MRKYVKRLGTNPKVRVESYIGQHTYIPAMESRNSMQVVVIIVKRLKMTLV